MADEIGRQITISLMNPSADAIAEAFADEAVIDSLLQSDILFEVAAGNSVEEIARVRGVDVDEVKKQFVKQARMWRNARDALIDMLYAFDIARIEVLLNRLMRLASHDETSLKKLSQLIVDIIMKKSMLAIGVNYASQVRNAAAIRTESVRSKLQMLEAKIRSWDSEQVVKKSIDNASGATKPCQEESRDGMHSN